MWVATLCGYNLTFTNLMLFIKEKEERAFSLTFALVLTFPADGASWHMVKIHGKSR